MNWVMLNGVKSTLIKGLLIQSLPPISKPLLRSSVDEIDGRDGDIITPLGYAAYNKEMTIGLYGDYDIDEVISFFNSDGLAGEVIFSNEIDKYYRYQILEQIDFERLIRFRTATVVFHVQPFKYSSVDEEVNFSINRLHLKKYHREQDGIEVTGHTSGNVSIVGTAEADTEFFIRLDDMTLEAGLYTIELNTHGSGQSDVRIRIIDTEPTDADSLFNTDLTPVEGISDITNSLGADKTFRYLWISVTNGAEVNFVMIPKVLDLQIHSFSVLNRGYIKSKPVITVFGSGTITLKVNDRAVGVTLTMGTYEFIRLNLEDMNAYHGTDFVNRSVSGDLNLLALDPGTNVISWTGSVTDVSVKDYSRWL